MSSTAPLSYKISVVTLNKAKTFVFTLWMCIFNYMNLLCPRSNSYLMVLLLFKSENVHRQLFWKQSLTKDPDCAGSLCVFADEFLEEIQRLVESKLSTVSREITDSRVKTREELDALYRKIVNYILLRSGMGSPTDVSTMQEATGLTLTCSFSVSEKL